MVFVSAFTAFGSLPGRAGSLPTESPHGSLSYKGLTALMDDKAKEKEGTRDFFIFKEKVPLSERHIVNRVSPNLESFYQEGAHRG